MTDTTETAARIEDPRLELLRRRLAQRGLTGQPQPTAAAPDGQP